MGFFGRVAKRAGRAVKKAAGGVSSATRFVASGKTLGTVGGGAAGFFGSGGNPLAAIAGAKAGRGLFGGGGGAPADYTGLPAARPAQTSPSDSTAFSLRSLVGDWIDRADEVADEYLGAETGGTVTPGARPIFPPDVVSTVSALPWWVWVVAALLLFKLLK